MLRPAFSLRQPEPPEAEAMTRLVLRSKAAWGYDEAFMLACRGELAISPELVASQPMMAAYAGAAPVGLAQLAMAGEAAELVKLFIDPGCQRSGVGRRLFEWVVETARRTGCRTLAVESDPHAAEFYRRMGMVDDGQVPSGSIAGRMLPRLKLSL